MNLLLDTHILIWALFQDWNLSKAAKTLLEDVSNNLYYSLFSILEIELKHLSRPDAMPFSGDQVLAYCYQAGFSPLYFKESHILQLKNLKRKTGTAPHKDPFDKIMLCQAMAEDMLFVTHDYKLAGYDTDCIRHV